MAGAAEPAILFSLSSALHPTLSLLTEHLLQLGVGAAGQGQGGEGEAGEEAGHGW